MAVGSVGLAAVVALVALVVVVANRSSPVATPVAPSTTPRPLHCSDHSDRTGSAPPDRVGSLTVDGHRAGHRAVRRLAPSPTYVRFPARAGAGARGRERAGPVLPPYGGTVPLVVFSGGFAVNPEEYSVLLDRWAAAGFMVADPVYPFTSPSPTLATSMKGTSSTIPATCRRFDHRTLLAANADAGTPTGPGATLAGTIDPDRIAAIGHSRRRRRPWPSVGTTPAAATPGSAPR